MKVDEALHVFVGKESDRYRQFREKHYKLCNNPGKFNIYLMGTGIGECIKVNCPYCGAWEDITDTTAW